MHVCLYVDPHTSGCSQDMADSEGFEDAREYEYHNIEEQIRNAFPGKTITFERDILFRQLHNIPFDFYVFDIRGMCVVDHDGRSRLRWATDVVSKLADFPSSGFVPWTLMTWQMARAALDDLVLGDATEVPDGYKTPEPHNLFLPHKHANWDADFDAAVQWMVRFAQSGVAR